MMNRNRAEIVSPGGNFEKMRFALMYGADAVYFGGEEFNLRDKAGNFSFDEIKKGVELCHSSGAKAFFLLNAFLHEADVLSAESYVKSLAGIDFDAVIVSDPGMLVLVREHLNCKIHISTQQSTLNHLSVKFWQSQGASRIVLARETTLPEIKMIKDYSDAEIEIFAHGAVCVSYSGRCLLSRYFTGKDANSGVCTQPCRWKYKIIEEKRLDDHFEVIEHKNATEILSSKDLCLIENLGEYIEAGVDAFKIEGRMKSAYYAAGVTRIYKDALNEYYSSGNYSSKLPKYNEELDLISHRPYTDDLFHEFEKGYESIPYIQKTDFLGVSLSSSASSEIIFKAYNPVYAGTSFEFIAPIEEGKFIDGYCTLKEITDINNETLKYEMARPNAVYKAVFDKEMPVGSVFRMRVKEKE